MNKNTHESARKHNWSSIFRKHSLQRVNSSYRCRVPAMIPVTNVKEQNIRNKCDFVASMYLMYLEVKTLKILRNFNLLFILDR